MLSISNSELKDKALNDLKGNWTQPVLASLVYMVIAIIFSGDPSAFNSSNIGMQQNFTVWSGICLLVSLFFILPMAYSYMLIFLDFIRGEKEKLVGKLFSFFQELWKSLRNILYGNTVYNPVVIIAGHTRHHKGSRIQHDLLHLQRPSGIQH